MTNEQAMKIAVQMKKLMLRYGSSGDYDALEHYDDSVVTDVAQDILDGKTVWEDDYGTVIDNAILDEVSCEDLTELISKHGDI